MTPILIAGVLSSLMFMPFFPVECGATALMFTAIIFIRGAMR